MAGRLSGACLVGAAWPSYRHANHRRWPRRSALHPVEAGMGIGLPGPAILVPANPGGSRLPPCPVDHGRRAQSVSGLRHRRLGGHRADARGGGGRGASRPAIESLSCRARQQGQGLRYWPVGRVQTSQLLLRMAWLGGVCSNRDRRAGRLSLGFRRACQPGADVLASGLCLRHSAARGSYAALARRPVPPLPGA